jgi:hypothetical protein
MLGVIAALVCGYLGFKRAHWAWALAPTLALLATLVVIAAANGKIASSWWQASFAIAGVQQVVVGYAAFGLGLLLARARSARAQ